MSADARSRPQRKVGAHDAREVSRLDVSFSYAVVFVDDVFAPDCAVLSDAIAEPGAGRRPKVLVFMDEGLAAAAPELASRVMGYLRAWSSRCDSVAEAPVFVPGGEAAKQGFAAIEPMLARVHADGLDRHDTIVAIGGGAVLDAVGFVAAIAHRGIRHVRIPTTVLSQNDAGVGVKNAINVFGVKNFAGTFATPSAVLVDASLLSTLGERDQRAGMAEAVKVAAIRDAEFFAWLERHADDLRDFRGDAVATSIRRAATLHLDHIRSSGDPFERGSARPLDFGHWAAHKLESMTAHALRHGEAVAIGMCIDTAYAVAVGHASSVVYDRLVALLTRLGLPTSHPALGKCDAAGQPLVLAGLEEFRQHLGGALSITLLAAVGAGVQVDAIDRELMATVCHHHATR